MATRRTSDSTRNPKPAAPPTPTSAKTPAPSSSESGSAVKASRDSAGAKSSSGIMDAAAERTPAAKPEAARSRTSKPKVTKPVGQGTSSAPQVSAETRRAMIAESAYLRAERRGFVPGHEVEDWCAAEREVDALLNANPGVGAQ